MQLQGLIYILFNSIRHSSIKTVIWFLIFLLFLSCVSNNEVNYFELQNLENGYNVIQLETAVGAAIKNFEGALGKV